MANIIDINFDVDFSSLFTNDKVGVGRYDAVVRRVRIMTLEKAGGQVPVIDFDCSQNGKKVGVFDLWLKIQHANEVVARIARNDLAKLALCAGYDSLQPDLDLLVGANVRLDVVEKNGYTNAYINQPSTDTGRGASKAPVKAVPARPAPPKPAPAKPAVAEQVEVADKDLDDDIPF